MQSITGYTVRSRVATLTSVAFFDTRARNTVPLITNGKFKHELTNDLNSLQNRNYENSGTEWTLSVFIAKAIKRTYTEEGRINWTPSRERTSHQGRLPVITTPRYAENMPLRWKTCPPSVHSLGQSWLFTRNVNHYRRITRTHRYQRALYWTYVWLEKTQKEKKDRFLFNTSDLTSKSRFVKVNKSRVSGLNVMIHWTVSWLQRIIIIFSVSRKK